LRRSSANGKSSTAIALRMTSACGPRTASTAPAPARGKCSSRTASSPGRCRPPTTRCWRKGCRHTSRAAASAASPSRGISTARCASSTRTRAAHCSTSGAPRGRNMPTRSTRGRPSSTAPCAAAATSRRSARAASAASAGTRPWKSSRHRSSTRSRRSGRTGSTASRPSRPCHRFRMPPARAS